MSDAFQSLSGSDAVAFGDTNTGEPHLDEEAKFFNAKEAAWFDQIRSAGWVDVWAAPQPRRSRVHLVLEQQNRVPHRPSVRDEFD